MIFLILVIIVIFEILVNLVILMNPGECCNICKRCDFGKIGHLLSHAIFENQVDLNILLNVLVLVNLAILLNIVTLETPLFDFGESDVPVNWGI